MQDNLLKNADFLENVINAIPSIIFVVDSQIRIQRVNHPPLNHGSGFSGGLFRTSGRSG